MDLRVYEILFQFNRGLDQALGSLDALERLALESPGCITKIRVKLSELRSYANNCIASKQREEARKAKGLPRRVVILPDWDYNDEKRYEEERAERKKHATNRRRKKTKKPAPKLAKSPQPSIAISQPNATPPHEEGNHR